MFYFYSALHVSVLLPNTIILHQILHPNNKKNWSSAGILNQLMKENEDGALVFRKQGEVGFKLNTDGVGIFYEHGKYKTITKTNLWWLELGERYSPKEDRQSGLFSDQFGFGVGNPYKYGKINNFYYLKLGIAQQLLIGGKKQSNMGVAVSLIYGGGIGIGLFKTLLFANARFSAG